MKRRVRVCNCPFCSAVIKLDRAKPTKHYEYSITVTRTTCTNCCCSFLNHMVKSWLEDHQDET